MNQTDLNSFNNDWYQPGSAVKRGIWYLCNALFIYNPLNPFSGLKSSVLRMFGAKIGQGVIIKPKVTVKYPWFLEVGDHCWIGEKVWIDNLGMTKIGSNVCLSQGSMLLCGNHNYKKSTFDLMVGEITLEDGVWIGAHAVVTPGITCHSHSILSVNSVASSNLEAYTIYQGIPAVEVRKRVIE